MSDAPGLCSDVARRLRENLADGSYHVYARGNAKRLLFMDSVDRDAYLNRLAHVVTRKRWRCLAYCLMDNHLHLLLETPDPNLSAGMQWLHGGYAQYFNRRHNRTGHLFQGRYGAVRIKSDGQMCVTARYLARNPVDAGLCRRPSDWRWSSYPLAVKRARIAWLDSGRLLEYFGSNEQAAYAMYLGLCEEGVELPPT